MATTYLCAKDATGSVLRSGIIDLSNAAAFAGR
jgi:hypothetical protein